MNVIACKNKIRSEKIYKIICEAYYTIAADRTQSQKSQRNPFPCSELFVCPVTQFLNWRLLCRRLRFDRTCKKPLPISQLFYCRRTSDYTIAKCPDWQIKFSHRQKSERFGCRLINANQKWPWHAPLISNNLILNHLIFIAVAAAFTQDSACLQIAIGAVVFRRSLGSRRYSRFSVHQRPELFKRTQKVAVKVSNLCLILHSLGFDCDWPTKDAAQIRFNEDFRRFENNVPMDLAARIIHNDL